MKMLLLTLIALLPLTLATSKCGEAFPREVPTYLLIGDSWLARSATAIGEVSNCKVIDATLGGTTTQYWRSHLPEVVPTDTVILLSTGGVDGFTESSNKAIRNSIYSLAIDLAVASPPGTPIVHFSYDDNGTAIPTDFQSLMHSQPLFNYHWLDLTSVSTSYASQFDPYHLFDRSYRRRVEYAFTNSPFLTTCSQESQL